jgi:nicotinate-nucleotide adenylyltransferase
MNQLTQQINAVFVDAFGRTPLRQRLADVFGEAVELSRFTDLRNLREEAGDLLCSVLQLCNECDWDAEELVANTLAKITRRKLQYHSLGRKTSVAILGGAFDPPTLAHVRVAQYVLNTSKTFDEIWVLPCYQHMHGKELVSVEHRFRMLELACRVDARVKPCDYEIRNFLRGETYQTVKLLLEEQFAKDEYDFSWIIGMDNANEFHKWVNYEYLEKMIRFVVVPRDGYAPQPKVDWYLKPPHIFIGHTDGKVGEMSSTLVRQMVADMGSITMSGEFARGRIRDLLDEKVLAYIKEHKLYGSEGI